MQLYGAVVEAELHLAEVGVVDAYYDVEVIAVLVAGRVVAYLFTVRALPLYLYAALVHIDAAARYL